MNESALSNYGTKSAFVGMREAVDVLDLSEPAIRRKEAAGEMPKRVNTGLMRRSGRPSKTGWPRDVFYAWLKSVTEKSQIPA